MRILVPLIALLLFVPLASAEGQPQPYPPGYLDATWESSDDGLYMQLSWQAPSETGSSGLDGYLLHKVDADGLLTTTPLDATATSYQDFGVVADGTYAYYVTAVNTDGWESPPSNPVFIHGDYPHCGVFGYTLGPPPNYVLQPGCLLPPPV